MSELQVKGLIPGAIEDLLVIGSTEWTTVENVYQLLDQIQPCRVVSGPRVGAEHSARKWAAVNRVPFSYSRALGPHWSPTMALALATARDAWIRNEVVRLRGLCIPVVMFNAMVGGTFARLVGLWI